MNLLILVSCLSHALLSSFQDNKHGSLMIIPNSLGPIARTVGDCALFLEAVCVPEIWKTDLNLPPVPFDKAAYQKTASQPKLRIGYYYDDGWFEPCATSKRGIRETIAKLQAAGHECVPFRPPTDGWTHYGM